MFVDVRKVCARVCAICVPNAAEIRGKKGAKMDLVERKIPTII
jgi:hypothetical protein